MIKVGFIGVGGMGMGQANSFAEAGGCKVVAASDVSDKSRANFLAKFPDAKAYASHKELLADNNVDAVVLATPTLMHKDVAIDAMKSGRPVMTEKPMARTVADCKKMIDASQKTRKLLMVAHCRRFDTDWGNFAKIIKAGTIGGPVLWRHISAGMFSLYSTSKWFLDDKLGGGPLIDGAVHNYDFANLIFGEPDFVLSSGIKLDKSCTAVDTGSVIIRYKSGNQLLLSWSWAVCGSGCHDVIGPKGSFMFGPGDMPLDGLDTKDKGYHRVASADGKTKKLVPFKRTNMYVTQARHFLACINGKVKCTSPGTEAIKAVAVAEALLSVANKGGQAMVKW